MKTFLKILASIFILLIAFVLIAPLFIANDYSVEKSVYINADQEFVHSVAADFRQFDNWNPWLKLDPNMEIEVNGESGAVGSTYHWKGNDEAGEGIMKITEKDEEKISVLLKFITPFESESMNYYHAKNDEGMTKFTWQMNGSVPYPMNIMFLFMDFEKEIGNDFEEGLMNRVSDNFRGLIYIC